MEMMKLLSLSMSLLVVNIAFFTSTNLMAKTEPHHVVAKTPEDESVPKTAEKTKKNSKVDSVTKNKTEAKSKTTKSTVNKQKTSNKTEKPLTSDSSTTIVNNLPSYIKDWMKYLNKDCSSDCTLTYADVLKLIEDSHIEGQQAAVLGAIVTQMNNTKSSTIKYTVAELQTMFKANDSIYSWYYETAIKNINGVRALSGPQDKLFGPTGTLSSSTRIIQNALGDCFLLSAVNGLLHLPGGPEQLQNMISRVPGTDNEFLVTLPGDIKTIHVKLTPAKLAMYSNLPAGGEWLAVLSDAVAKARKMNPEKGVFKGGYQTQTLHLLTGIDYENKVLSPFTRGQVDLLKTLSTEQWSALVNLSSAQLATLSTLTPKELEGTLTKDQIKAFEKLTPEELSKLQKISSAKWNELSTLVTDNAGYIDLKLLKTLKPISQAKLTNQIEAYLNAALNESNPPKIVGIETNEHDLTVLAYNSKTQILTIKNPWGNTGWYNPVTGAGPDTSMPANGTTPPWFDMKNGVFHVQLSQLVESNFVTMTLPKEIVKETKISDSTSKVKNANKLQAVVAAANKLSPEEKEKIKVTLDEAVAYRDKIAAYQAEIKATQTKCKESITDDACQIKLNNLADKLEKTQADAEGVIDKLEHVVNNKE